MRTNELLFKQLEKKSNDCELEDNINVNKPRPAFYSRFMFVSKIIEKKNLLQNRQFELSYKCTY